MEEKEAPDNLNTSRNKVRYKSQQALAQYIGIHYILDISAAVQSIVSGNIAVFVAKFKSLGKSVSHLKYKSDVELSLVKLDMRLLLVMVVSDESFANSSRNKSHLGFLVFMADGQHQVHTMHSGSCWGFHGSCSVMAAEVRSFLKALKNGCVICDALTKMLGCLIYTEAYVDSRLLLDVIEKVSKAAERRLPILFYAMIDYYNRSKMKKLG